MQDLDLSGKRVFIRADLNVPLDDSGNIADDTRIRASLPGIRGAAEAGAAVMVTSHLGRPKEGELRLIDSLAPVAKRLGELLKMDVELKQNWVDGVDVSWRIVASTKAKKATTKHWHARWRNCVTSM